MRLLTVQSEDAQRAAYDDREALARAVLRVAVNEALRLIRRGELGRAEFVLTRAGMKADRILGPAAHLTSVAGVNGTAPAAPTRPPAETKDATERACCLLSEPGAPAPATTPLEGTS